MHVDDLRNGRSRSGRGDGRNFGSAVNSWRNRGSSRRVSDLLRVRLVRGAITRDVTGLRTLVADLSGRTQWPAIGCSAVTRNVALIIEGQSKPGKGFHKKVAKPYQFPTCIAFHSLRLTIPGEMVWTTTLIAGSRPRIPGITATETSIESSARGRNTRASSRLWARCTRCTSGRAISLIGMLAFPPLYFCPKVRTKFTYCQMTGLVAIVAPTSTCATVKTEGRAVSLDVT